MAREIGQKIDPVQMPGRGELDPGGRQGGGQNIELDHGAVLDRAGWDVALPLHDERHADATLPGLGFEAPQWAVARCDRLRGAAVVTEKHNERVVLQPVPSDRSHHNSHGIVHRGEHCSEGAAFWVCHVGESIQVSIRSLERRVHGIEGNETHPRLVRVSIDEGGRLMAESVGEVVDLGQLSLIPQDGIEGILEGVEIVMLAAKKPKK